ncbi:MAG: HAMP domain-containing protein [PVC group bacterium]|nr:HAMP domain-containing protein [PVC group bacterium]
MQIAKAYKSAVYISEDMIAEFHDLAKLVVDMETGQRGFIITGKEEFLEPFHAANEKFDALLKELRLDFGGQAKYLMALEKIEHLRYKWMGVAGDPEIKARRLVNKTSTSLKSINKIIQDGRGKKILDKIRAVIDTMSNDFKIADIKDALILITKIGKDVVDSETGERGFLLTGRDSFLEPYYAGQIAFNKHAKELESMLQGDKQNLERLAVAMGLYEEWLARAAMPEIQARLVYEKNPHSMDDVAILLAAGAGKRIIDELRTVIDELIESLTNDIKRKFYQSQQRVEFVKFISMAVGGGGIFLSLIIALILGKAIINPIRLLTEGTDIIGRGDLDHKIELKSKDELGVLADSFNKMSENLSKRDEEINVANQKLLVNEQQLKTLNKSLEQKVQERTKELMKNKEELEVRVQERTKELKEKLKELEIFHKLACGREMKMIEMKKQVNAMSKELGRPEPYA